MASLGRRRPPLHLSLLSILLLLILSSTATAASAVLGIDVGTEYVKAALVKPGIPLEIVLTKDSKRKEAATIAFKPLGVSGTDAGALPERLYGGDANSLAARFPNHVYPNLKVLLGVEASSKVVEDYKTRYPGVGGEPVIRNEGRSGGTVGFKSQALDEGEPPLMVEELLAMELKNIRMNAKAAAGGGGEVTDIVLTMPAFYTAEEKRALRLAADLAGLRVLGLISDGLAVGLNYATSRTFPSSSEGAKPEFHLVYDMGAGSTSATVLKFQGRTVKDIGKRNKTIQEVQVMSTKWRKDLGGDAWNQVIVEDMAAKLAEMPKVVSKGFTLAYVRENGKAMARLWKEAERMRQVLSANTKTAATLEGLLSEDVVFKYQLSRNEFEELTQPYASEVAAPLIEALEAADVTVESLDSVILHGGAVRTPFVQKQLEVAAGSSSKVRTNVNADEAAVLGAAFKAAEISPSFRVKEIRAEDTSGFDVRLKWTTDGRERTQRLFTPRSAIGAEKVVSFASQEDFAIEISQTVEEKDVPISEVKTLNLTASHAHLKEKYHCSPANISTKLTLRLSALDGLPELVSGSVSCETDVMKEGGVMDNVKGLFGFGSKKPDDQVPLKDGDESEEPKEQTKSESSSTSRLKSESSTASGVSKSTADNTPSPSSTTVNIPVAFTTRPLGLNSPLPTDSLKRIRARLSKFDSSDQARILRSEALNALESFTYRARDYVSESEFIAHAPQSIRDTLERELAETGEWLYGDGVDAKRAEFQQRMKDLRALIEPVLNRREEASKREGVVKGVEQGLEQMKGMIEMVRHSVEQAELDRKRADDALAEEEAKVAAESLSSETAAPTDNNKTVKEEDEEESLDDDPYLSSSTTTTAPTSTSSSVISPFSPSDLSTLQSSYDSISAWLSTGLEQQSRLTASEDPALLVRDLEAKSQELQDVVKRVVMKNVQLPGGGGGGGKEKKEGVNRKDQNKSAQGQAQAQAQAQAEAQSTDGSRRSTTTTRSKDEL